MLSIKYKPTILPMHNEKLLSFTDQNKISIVLKFSLTLFTITILLLSVNYTSPIYGQSDNANLPNIDAKSIYDTGTAILGNNIRNLFILIPDEAHHGNGEAKENRFIEQSFLPQNAVVNKGTNVIWFSGDVSHEHRIIINNDESLFDSGTIPEYSASNPMAFNTIGDFSYNSPDVSQEAKQKGFVMTGNVKVIDQPHKVNTNPTANVESVGVFMVPTKDIDDYTKDFTHKGFTIDSTYSFNDLRGLARDTGSQQTLLVWTADPNMTTDTIILALADIGSNLPYK
jgi:hypothetical protein